jgi:hypothetical protein
MKNSSLLLERSCSEGRDITFCIVSLPVILRHLQKAELGMQLAIQNQRNLTAATFC